MKQAYVSLTFDTTGYDTEIWMAMLSEWPFESFHEEENQVVGYILLENLSKPLLEWMVDQQGHWYVDYVLTHVEDKNWNAIWESSFNPVAIPPFCYIRAEFHSPAPEGFKHELVIYPKMAFGTGHHATTFMMLEAMSQLNFIGKTVLDFGCGTGILAVMAAKEGAAQVTGIDIQPEAIENSNEHAEKNHVRDHCQFFEGGLDLVSNQKFDIILANINTHVITAHIKDLQKMLRPGGYLLLSGIMIMDTPYMEEHIAFEPLEFIYRQERGEWLQMTWRQPK